MSDLAAFSRFADISVRLAVELGRAELPLGEVLRLGEGSVVPLDRLTDELLDVTANGRPIAKAEVLARDGRFALRIVSLGEDGPEPAGNAQAEPGRQTSSKEKSA
jgi:flagellar motor switch protein FliN/FliY